MKQLSGVIARGDGLSFAGRISFDAQVTGIEATAAAGDDHILPGFIDLQVNGSDGIEVLSAEPDAMLKLARDLAREGTTGFLPTVTTAPLDQIERAHSAIARAIESQTSGGSAVPEAAILGMHLEGPFISPLRRGAHPPLTEEPRGEPLERVIRLGRLKLVTLAPELPGALEAIARLCARDVVVSIGHSDARLSVTYAAIAAGARMFTHLFNAMRPLHHRDPGVVAAALLAPEAVAAVIADGVHVAPEVLRLVYRIKGAAGMILTTDKVATAKARLDDGTLAGSVVPMGKAARLLVEKVGVGVGEVAQMAAANPAAMLRLEDRGILRVGARADVVLLSRDFELKAVFIEGREVT